MIELNQEQYEKLKLYEKQMTMAYKGHYIAGIGPKKVEIFLDIYNELFSKHESYNSASCAKCLYNIVYKLGELYFKYQDSHKEELQVPSEQPSSPSEQTAPSVNKRGRKKKISN